MSGQLGSSAKIFVTGHQGLVGSAVMRAIGEMQRRRSSGTSSPVRIEFRAGDAPAELRFAADASVRFESRFPKSADILISSTLQTVCASRSELDLRDQAAVQEWFAVHQPEGVIHCAGTVGGIHANQSRPVDFYCDNTLMHLTVLRAAWQSGVKKLLYLGSSCIYPRECPQPIREEYLMTGPLEATNDAYAIAKISGLLSCQFYRRQYGCNFISAMPTNLYGPNDNFDLDNSHVLPALIRKFHDAKTSGDAHVTVWGTGKPRREFLYVDDLASACLFLMEHYDDESPINVGTGQDVSIAELADLVRSVVYPEAKVRYDTSKPDGTPQKLLDVSRVHSLGWHHQIELEDGVRQTYQWFEEHRDQKEVRLDQKYE